MLLCIKKSAYCKKDFHFLWHELHSSKMQQQIRLVSSRVHRPDKHPEQKCWTFTFGWGNVGAKIQHQLNDWGRSVVARKKWSRGYKLLLTIKSVNKARAVLAPNNSRSWGNHTMMYVGDFATTVLRSFQRPKSVGNFSWSIIKVSVSLSIYAAVSSILPFFSFVSLRPLCSCVGVSCLLASGPSAPIYNQRCATWCCACVQK